MYINTHTWADYPLGTKGTVPSGTKEKLAYEAVKVGLRGHQSWPKRLSMWPMNLNEDFFSPRLFWEKWPII